jgi:hypothetical protein
MRDAMGSELALAWSLALTRAPVSSLAALLALTTSLPKHQPRYTFSSDVLNSRLITTRLLNIWRSYYDAGSG